MKVSLSVFERLLLGNILPKEGNFTTLKVVKDAQSLIGFTEEEHALLQFKHGGETYKDSKGIERTVPEGTIHWQDKVEEKEFDIGLKVIDVISTVIKKMDAEKKLNMTHMSLYEKFVSND
jgi:hypothetical protein